MHGFMKQDNKHGFLSMINLLPSDDVDKFYTRIFSYDAAHCLAAILDGEAGQILTARFAEDVHRNIPLHRAARGVSPRIAALLIDRGFSPDLRSDVDCPVILKNALPLNVSLAYLRILVWKVPNEHASRRRSVIHLITGLCGKELNLQRIIKVLARNTKEIKHEFYKYLKQGRVVEVGALLVSASDLILSSSSTLEGEKGFKNLMEMHQFLLAEMSMSMSLGASTEQLMEMKETLQLLEIFDRIGDKLVAHTQETLQLVKIFDRIGDKLVAHMQEIPQLLGIFERTGHKLDLHMQICDDDSVSDPRSRVASLIEDAGVDVNADVLCMPTPFRPCPTTCYKYEKRPNVIQRGHYVESTMKGHFPTRLGGGISHFNAPFPLPREGSVLPYFAVGGPVTKHVFLKHSSFTGAFAKAIRHLRYL